MLNPGRGRRRLVVTFAIAIASMFAATGPAQADNAFVDDFPNVAGIQNTVDAFGEPGQVVEVNAPWFNLDFAGDRHLPPGGSFQTTLDPNGSPYVAYDAQTWTVPTSWTAGSRFTFRPRIRVTLPSTLGRTTQFVSFTAATDACSPGLGSCITGNSLTVQVRMETKPRPVSDEKATGDNTGIDLTWAHTPDQSQITGYYIDRSDMSPGGRTRRFYGLDKNKATFRDTEVEPGKQYCYRISAYWEGAGGAFNASSPGQVICAYLNRAPGSPGGPSPDPSLSNGPATVSWAPASDPDGNDVTYTLQHRDADDGDWSTYRAGVTGTSLPVVEESGTWHYRVRATDQLGVEGNWSEAGPEHKADATRPGLPQVSYDKEPAAGNWFADSVTVSFGGAVDGDLPDGSQGSGIDPDTGYTAPVTVDEEGEHTVSGTATDRAGNESDAASPTVRVDTTKPQVEVACPTDPVLLNSDQAVGWTATDTGSGLATPASGTVDLETGTAGPKQVDIPVASDAVGHESEAKTCAYEVNSPPAAPGAPSGPAYDRDGSFDLSWDGASDPDGDTVGYVVEQRDARGGAWSSANAGDDSTTLSVTVPSGRWSFRVKAVDGRGGESAFTEANAPIVVDAEGPTAPQAQFAPAESHDGWFKDAVTVSWGGSTDPALEDLSDGSGIDPETGYSREERFETEGDHTATGTATDRAGNSTEASVTVKVDISDPSADITCPTDRVVLDTPATADWAASDTGSGLAGPDSGTESLDTSAVGMQTATITVRDRVGHEATATCQYEVVPPNSAPAAPGAPNGPDVDRDGGLTVRWSAADDPDEGDSATYVLETHDAGDAGWTPLADGIDVPRADVQLTPGTWTFRVKAVDTHGAETDWVESSSATVVDDTKPTAPVATTDPADPASATGDWFKDSVKVAFAGSTDPDLADGSAGSGVDSYDGGQTFDTDGEHTATGTAIDRAGNRSDPTGKTVKVDASAPATRIACPADPLLVGQPGATAAWTASDGESGLATPASGAIALNTATAGIKRATAPAARDNVGHTGDTATCEYEVRYRFTGGVAPVEGSNVINVGKHGRTYPVRWRLFRWNGSLISDAEGTALAGQMSATDTKVTCSSFLSAGEDGLEEETGLPSPSLRYDTKKNWFVYSYRAPAAGCYTLDIRRADGVNTKRWRFLFL